MALGNRLLPSEGADGGQRVRSSSSAPAGGASTSSHSQRFSQSTTRDSATSQYSLLCPRTNNNSNNQQQLQHQHRHQQPTTSDVGGSSGVGGGPWWKSLTKKYVILCCICGGSAVLLGVIFISIYFTLNYYTSSLQYFETIPTYAPAVVLIITGLLVMCFSRRRNRYAYLIKLAGGCCLVCAVLCVVITVTTTVIHMNRLQTLRECVYTQKSKICTCFAGIGDEEGTAKYVFNNTPDCEVVHGSLYTCLRAMFGLSVIGILVCIFSSMLVYQLLSHEKKKMYWEQLEMRRRFYYRQPSHPLYCNCYDDYGFAASAAPPHDMYWQPWEISTDRCWPIRGITPRLAFSADDGGGGGGSGSQHSILVGSTGHRASGWNWLPWSRNHHNQSGGSNAMSAPLNNTSNEQLSTIANINQNELDNDRHVNRLQNNLNDESSPRLPSFGAVLPYWSAETRFGGTNSSRRNGRRRRSNDAVFHHLSMTPPSRYRSPFCVAESGYAPPISFSAYNSLSRHMWGPPPPYSQQSSVENVAESRSMAEQNAPPHLRHFFRAATIANPGNIRCNSGGGNSGIVVTDHHATMQHQPQTQLIQQQQQQLHEPHSLAVQTGEVMENEPVKIYSNDLMVRVGNEEPADPIYNNTVCKSSFLAGKTMISEGTSTLPNLQHRKEEEATVLTSKSASYLPPKTVRDVWSSTRRSNHVFSSHSCSSSSCSSRSSNSSNSSSSNSSNSGSSSGDSFEIESDFRSSVLVSTSSSTDSNNPNAFATDILCVRSLPNLNLAPQNIFPKAKSLQQPSVPLPLPLPPPPPPSTAAVQRAAKNKRVVHKVAVPNRVKTESYPALPVGVTLVNGGFYVQNNCVLHNYSENEPKSKSAGALPLQLPLPPPPLPLPPPSTDESIIVTFKSVHV